VGSKFPEDAAALKKALDLRGLQVCNRWFSTFLISKPFEQTERPFRAQCEFLRALGAEVIGVSEQSYSTQGMITQPVFENRHEMDGEEWDLLSKGLMKLSDIAGEYGISLCFHHHMGTAVQTEEEIDRLMELTDCRVGLLYDTGHLVFAGIDPVKLLKKHVLRIKHVHLKDVRLARAAAAKEGRLSFLSAVREGVFTVPGDGGIDFSPVFDILKQAGYSGWMVVEAEQDPAKADPLEYALKARAYIKKTLGI